MSTEPAIIDTGCKINLYLHVGERQLDGYHGLDSLFIPLEEPSDTLIISRSTAKGIRLSFYGQYSAEKMTGIDPYHNTVTKAYALYKEAACYVPPLDIAVHKGIPHGAGLGGGSSDAAALLLWLQRWSLQVGRKPLPAKELNALAARVGADVPFFLLNRPAFAEGIGEKLTPTDIPYEGYYILLVCPQIKVSTAWAFATLDALREKNGIKIPPERLTSDITHATKSLARGVQLRNDFEDVVFAEHPSLYDYFTCLKFSGAEYTRMSGTGSTLFALFKDKKIAQNAAKKLAMSPVTIYMQRLSGWKINLSGNV